jgi:glucose/arabinose dehydrogenase
VHEARIAFLDPADGGWADCLHRVGAFLFPRWRWTRPAAAAPAPDADPHGKHRAGKGLARRGAALSAWYARGMFVGLHGSWNRRPLSGDSVVFVGFRDGKPSGMPSEVLTGFVNADGEAHGRPVGVAISKRGALLVADDVGNTVWHVSAADGVR